MRPLLSKPIETLIKASLCSVFVVCQTHVYAHDLHAEHSAANNALSNKAQHGAVTLEQSDASAQLSGLLDEIWQYELSQFPGLARSKGLKAVDLPRQFTDITMPAMTARHARFTDFMSQLANVDENALPSEDRISLIMQKYRLQNYISQFEFKEYRVPITSEYGFHSSIGRALSNVTLKNEDDVAVHVQRLQEAAQLIDLNVAYMREGMENGHSQPQAVLAGFEDSIAVYIVDDIKEHPFSKSLFNAKEGLLSDEQRSLLSTLVNDVNTAYKNFYNFFVNEYAPNAPKAIAATNWPDGNAFYDNRIKHYTTTDLSAQEIHDIGLSEVARIRAEMQQIVVKLEFDGDINAFIDFLRTDEQFYAKTPEDLIMYASYVAKQMDAKLPKLFYKMPRTPYGVAPVPDAIAPKYTTGRYISPNSDDEPGYYWVNTYALDKRPLYAIPALTLHEAVPGHHFQISLAAEMNDLPEVRRSTYISAFGEGWGLYSEYLGLEVGIYEDPYDDFGRLSYEMWRACRLVVDTGMHVFGWSRDKALAYMLENTALSEHNVKTEIDRYISWPAQALSYKLGEIKIKELRAEAETKLGDDFDLRAFHDAILAHGSVPLFVLEENMQAFIDGHL